jgi:copper chaperone NosL
MLSLSRRALLLSFALAACAKGSEPVDPFWGKQACDSCRMLVSDPVYAAQLLDERGLRHYFDDVGCMDAYLVDHPESKPRGLWVRLGSRWVAAESARYASGAATPMAYGFVAQELGPLDFAAVRTSAAAHRREHSR